MASVASAMSQPLPPPLTQPLQRTLSQPLPPPLTQPLPSALSHPAPPPLSHPVPAPLRQLPPTLSQPMVHPMSPSLSQPMSPPPSHPMSSPLCHPMAPSLSQPLPPQLISPSLSQLPPALRTAQSAHSAASTHSTRSMHSDSAHYYTMTLPVVSSHDPPPSLLAFSELADQEMSDGTRQDFEDDAFVKHYVGALPLETASIPTSINGSKICRHPDSSSWPAEDLENLQKEMSQQLMSLEKQEADRLGPNIAVSPTMKTVREMEALDSSTDDEDTNSEWSPGSPPPHSAVEVNQEMDAMKQQMLHLRAMQLSGSPRAHRL